MARHAQVEQIYKMQYFSSVYPTYVVGSVIVSVGGQSRDSKIKKRDIAKIFRGANNMIAESASMLNVA